MGTQSHRYRMHTWLYRGQIRLLTRTRLDCIDKYPAIVALLTLPARQAYLDGELCEVWPDGVTSFDLIQNPAERRGGVDLVYFVFHLDGRNLMPLAVADRKAALAALLERREDAIRYSEYQVGQGTAFHRHAYKLGLKGIVSKQWDALYSSSDRGLWVKTKCLNWEEFVVVGRTRRQLSIHRRAVARVLRSEAEADFRRPGWYRDAGRSARRSVEAVAAAADQQNAARCCPAALDPHRLAAGALGPARVGCRVHLTWTEDSLLRQVVFEGIREDKPAWKVVRLRPPT